MGEGTRELPESSRTLLVDLGTDYISVHLVNVCQYVHTHGYICTQCVYVCTC